jgi:bZIP transcription factor
MNKIDDLGEDSSKEKEIIDQIQSVFTMSEFPPNYHQQQGSVAQEQQQHGTLSLTQLNKAGFVAANQVTASSFVTAPLPSSLSLSSTSTFYSSIQHQQPSINNAAIGNKPYFSLINNSITSGSSAPNIQQRMNGTPLIPVNALSQISTDGNCQGNEVCTSSCFQGNGGSDDSSSPQYNDDGRMQDVRDRNRVNARTSRQRKKAYVNQLQSLVEKLQSERNEEIRQRTVSVQRTMDLHKVRRSVMVTFLNYHATYQTDLRKWSMILEETCWLKQPITPFRSFRRSEIEKVEYYCSSNFG